MAHESAHDVDTPSDPHGPVHWNTTEGLLDQVNTEFMPRIYRSLVDMRERGDLANWSEPIKYGWGGYMY